MSQKKSESAGFKIVAENRKARFNYQIIETYEAGLVLTGAEVKSVKAGSISLAESYVGPFNSELFLLAAHVAPYRFNTLEGYDPVRPKKLLLHKKEIEKLKTKIAAKGLTIVPLKVYLKDGRVKIEIGLAKGKDMGDKRQGIKEREGRREIDRALKRR